MEAFPLGMGMLREATSPIQAPRQVPSSKEQVSVMLSLMQGDSWALGIQQGGC